MAELMHLSPLLIVNIIPYLEGIEVNQFLSSSKDLSSLLQHVELQQLLLLKLLHNHFRRHFGEFNSLEIENPASTLYYHMNPQTWADEDEDVISKMINDTGFKIKRMKNHILNVCMRHFPKAGMVIEANSTNLLPSCYPPPTNTTTTRLTGILTETPFTVLTMKKNGLYNARLSCISYFEVQFISKSADVMMAGNKHKYDKFCFGVTTHQELQKYHESANHFSFVYNHNGKMMHSHSTFANDCYYRFNPTDVVGCGIVYPPLAENFGQVFFTRNGEVVHSELFTKKEYSSNSWFPFAMNANSYEAKFNFGLKRPLSFNIIAYESSKLASTSFLSYDQFLLNRPVIQNTVINWQLEQKYKHKNYHHHHHQRTQQDEEDDTNGDGYNYDDDNNSPSIQEIIVAHLMDADNSGSASNECSTSQSEDSGSEKKTSYHHRRHRHHQGGGGSNDDNNSSSMMLPPPTAHGFRTSPKSSIKKTAHQQQGKSNNQVNFSSSNIQYELERSDSRGSRNGGNNNNNQSEYGAYYDDHDGEDSMAVELSSVDSVAVNDLRDCGISIGGDADSAMAINGGDSVSVISTFTSPVLTQGMQHQQSNSHQSSHHQHQQHQQHMQQSDEMNGIGMEYNYALSASAAGMMDTTTITTNNTHGHYNTLADGNGALDWLQTASEANIQSRSFFALRSTDDGDSERSIATSLFVEVASVDDDGSYTGYGGRGYEDEDLDGEVDFIRGKLATSVDTQLQYESDESGARWFDGNSVSSRKSKSTTKRRLGSSADSQGSSGHHYNKKRRTGYSPYAQHETLAHGQQQQQQISQERIRQASPQANAMLVDEEDGYDGEEDGMDDMSTTDVQVPSAVHHNHSSSSSSLLALMPSSLQPFTAMAETIQHQTIMRRANTPSSGCSVSSTAGDGTQDLSPSGSENNSVGMVLPAVRSSYGSVASSSGNNCSGRPSRLRRRKSSHH